MSHLVTLFRRSAADLRPDGQLLTAFLIARDDDAFTELVRRHGPTVWGVCRRALPAPADAEDAFQATFLVLVQRASRLVAAPTVGPWLFEVAVRTAANARRKNSRRLARFACEPDTIADPRPATAPTTDLDKILLGLPERYRVVLLMCFFEGLTHREAAGRLGCAEGTVSSLVSRGLAKLRTKFGGRAPAVVLAVACVAAPAGLTAAVVRSAVAFRLTFLSAAAPPAVVALTRGVLRMFWIKKATTAAVVAAMLLAVVVGLGMSVGQSPQAAGQEEPRSKKAEPATAQPPPVPGEDAKGKPNKGDGKMSLEGQWLLVAKEMDGEKKEFPQGFGIELAISGDQFMIIDYQENVFDGKRRSGTTSIYHWRLAASLDGKPRGIDLVFKDDKNKAWKEGIYKLEGDKLTICWGEEKRPTDFTTKPGTGNTVNVFKRLDVGDRKDALPPEPVRPGTGGKGDDKKAEPPVGPPQPAGPYLVLTVRGLDGGRSPYTVTEFDARGKVIWSVTPGADVADKRKPDGALFDLKDAQTQRDVVAAVRGYLTRVKKDPNAPHDLRVVFTNDAQLGGFSAEALKCCLDAGFEKIHFTGYMPFGGFIPQLKPGPDGEAKGYKRYKGELVDTKKLLADYAQALLTL